MYLLAPFILENFKTILEPDPELWGCAIFGPKMAHLSWTKFFWYKSLLLLSSTYWPFSMCKILKNSYSGSRVMRCAILGAKMVHLLQTFFFWKIINIILIYLLAPLTVQNFKNSFSGSRVMTMHNFWVQNGPLP